MRTWVNMDETQVRLLALLKNMREKDATMKHSPIVREDMGGTYFLGRESAMKEIEELLKPVVLVEK